MFLEGSPRFCKRNILSWNFRDTVSRNVGNYWLNFLLYSPQAEKGRVLPHIQAPPSTHPAPGPERVAIGLSTPELLRCTSWRGPSGQSQMALGFVSFSQSQGKASNTHRSEDLS